MNTSLPPLLHGISSCPFCNAENEQQIRRDTENRWSVSCQKCGASGPRGTNPQEATERWGDSKYSSQILRTVIDESPDIIIVKDWNGKFLLTNEKLAKLYGTTPAEMVGKDDGDYNPNREQVNFYLQNIRAVMDSEKMQIVMESSTNVATGETRYFQSIKKPIEGPQGERRILVIAHDITDLQNLVLELEEQKRRFQYAMHAAGEGLWDWDIANETVTHNAYWCQILGFENEKLTHSFNDFAILVHPDDREMVKRCINAALGGSDAYQHEHRMVRRDGKIIWVQDRGEVVERDDAGKPLRMVGAVRDISVSKRRESLLLETQRELQAAKINLEKTVETRTGELVTANERLKTLLNQRSQILENQSVGVLVQNGRVIDWCNDALAKMLGYTSPDQLIGLSSRLLYAHDQDFETVSNALDPDTKARQLEHDYEFVHQDGNSVWVELSGSSLPTEEQSLWVVVNVTERVKAKRDLFRSEAKFRALFESNSQAIVLYENAGFIDGNEAAVRLFGLKNKAHLCNTDPYMLSPIYQPDGRTSMEVGALHIRQALDTGAARFEWTHKRSDTGNEFPCEILLTRINYDVHTLLIGLITDISERVSLLKKVEYEANHDFMTGLFSRRHFMELADRELSRAKRQQKSLPILLMDIDFFKRINDTYGHDAGDQALQMFANICNEILRKTDVIGRIGGEEFAAILPDTDRQQTMLIAERLRKRVEASPIKLARNGETVNFTVSIGITFQADPESNLATLLHEADLALYQAKNTGRNRTCTHDIAP